VGAPQGGGYPERLARLLPGLRLLNLCQGGATSADVLADQVPRTLYEKRIEMFNVHVTATAARHGLVLIHLYALSRELRGRNGCCRW